MSLENNKIRFYQRRHVEPPGHATHLLPVAAPLLNPTLIKEERGLVCNDSGRSHYAPWYSESPSFRSGMKLVPRKDGGVESIERGKKSIRPAQNGNVQEWTEQRKHNMEEYTRRSEASQELCIGFTKLRKYQPRNEAPQYDMEGFMNRKQRSGRSIEIMRNGIPVVVEGDRAFKVVDHEPGFYAKGGIIPGSTIQFRKSAKDEKKGGSGLITSGKTTKTGTLMSYAEKLRAKELEYELAQVSSLSVNKSREGEEVPSFEARTSCWLVTPEMEKD